MSSQCSSKKGDCVLGVYQQYIQITRCNSPTIHHIAQGVPGGFKTDVNRMESHEDDHEIDGNDQE